MTIQNKKQLDVLDQTLREETLKMMNCQKEYLNINYLFSCVNAAKTVILPYYQECNAVAKYHIYTLAIQLYQNRGSTQKYVQTNIGKYIK